VPQEHFDQRSAAAKTGLDMAGQAKPKIDAAVLEALLSRSAQGDHLAFEELYNATKGKIFGAALLILKRRDLAEEVVQETYVRIWTKASTFQPSLGSPIAWMTTIARNLAINIVRRPQFEMHADDGVLLQVPTNALSILDEIEHSQDQNQALAALQNLDPMSRRLILAAYVHGESRDDLSKRFGVPVNTIKTWIRRGLIETRAFLESAHYTGRTVA
jgi:RNA polymerase sigma-70 factor (ECF subfamily)